MNFKKTVILSIFLHVCFFTATLLWSAYLIEGSGRKPDEKVLFVELTDGKSKSESELSQVFGTTLLEKVAPTVVEKKKSKPENSPQIEKEKIRAIDTEKNINPIEKDVTSKHTDSYNTRQLSIKEGPTGNFTAADYEADKKDTTNVLDGQGIAVDVSYGLSSYKSRSESEGSRGGDILPSGIIELIRNSIEKVKTYPILARKRGIEGMVHISFRINLKGKPQDLKITKSSGSSVLDTATLDIVKKAAPFPYVDAPLEVPVVFRLKN